MSNKLEMQTADISKEKRELFEQLFPNCITETMVDGELKYSVDTDALSRELSINPVDPSAEKYLFSWPGKTEAKILASSPRQCA